MKRRDFLKGMWQSALVLLPLCGLALPEKELSNEDETMEETFQPAWQAFVNSICVVNGNGEIFYSIDEGESWTGTENYSTFDFWDNEVDNLYNLGYEPLPD